MLGMHINERKLLTAQYTYTYFYYYGVICVITIQKKKNNLSDFENLYTENKCRL